MIVRTTAILIALACLPATTPADQPTNALSAVQFDLVLGRLVAYSPVYHHTKRSAVNSSQGDVRESLNMNVKQGVADLDYELVTGGESWAIDVIDGVEVTIERRGGDNDSTLLRQPRDGPVVLLVEDINGQHRYSDKSIWHMLLTVPECRQPLITIIHFLRPGLRIDNMLQQIEAQLRHLAESESMSTRDQVFELVRQLGSDRFVDRQTSDRQLRRIGLAAFPYLEDLNRRQIDAEQRMRIERIMHDITWQRNDSPGRVAQWLVNDPSVR